MVQVYKVARFPTPTCLSTRTETYLQTHNVIQIGIQQLLRIEYNHCQGYIHQGLKPDKIVMGQGNEVKETKIY